MSDGSKGIRADATLEFGPQVDLKLSGTRNEG